MKRPQSRLHTILKVKQHQEKKAQLELGKIIDAKEKEATALDALSESERAAVGEAARPVRARASELQAGRSFIQNLVGQIKSQKKKLDDMTVREHHKREELTTRSQSRKMVEKLDSKRNDEMKKAGEKKEQSVVDSIAQRSRQESRSV